MIQIPGLTCFFFMAVPLLFTRKPKVSADRYLYLKQWKHAKIKKQKIDLLKIYD
jgi:hypothetical protein